MPQNDHENGLQTDLRLSPLFTDHMVLQQGKPIPVSGNSHRDLPVEVMFNGHTSAALPENGKWRIELPPCGAGGPYELTVRSGDRRLVLTDIWVGEVWLAGGQSNMEFLLSESAGGAEEAKDAVLPLVRYCHVPRIAALGGAAAAPAWQVCSPQTAGGFSAVAFHFAKQLAVRLQIPIGIINCNWGGTSASCWMDRALLMGDEELRVYGEEFDHAVSMKTPEEGAREEAEFQLLVRDYRRRKEELLQRGTPPTKEELGSYPCPPVHAESFRRPGGLYETMVKQVVPYPIRGVIWYQGEEDVPKGSLYPKLLTALIANWRQAWGEPELPFLLVQLSAFGAPEQEDWPTLREAQRRVAGQVPHTGMALSLDCGEWDDVHPTRKRPVGERLALLARRLVYGEAAVACFGPCPSRIRPDSTGAVSVEFLHAEGGLLFPGEECPGFELAGADGVFHPAAAVRGGSASLLVHSSLVPEPAAVRYAWSNYPAAELYNGFGLPAEPFCRQTGE